ncbi:MAG: 2-oxoisovalerate dehydrogenase [Pseudomonadota bacterium]
MNEITFLIEEATDGGYIARAVGHSIFTEADDLTSLHSQIRDAVRCHFEQGQGPQRIRLQFVREEVIAA